MMVCMRIWEMGEKRVGLWTGNRGGVMGVRGKIMETMGAKISEGEQFTWKNYNNVDKPKWNNLLFFWYLIQGLQKSFLQ